MPKSNEFPPSGQGGDEPSKWDSLTEDSQEEDLRDDENLTPEERLARSSKRLQELEDSTDPNAGDFIASERAFRQKLLSEMMNSPANDEANNEANQENVSAGIQSAEYYKEHPEEINNFVAELIKARGGEVKDGATWSKEQRAYVGDDGAPRDWAHLTGYLKKNPDEIGRFIDEYNQLTTAPKIDVSETTVEPAVAAGGGEGDGEGQSENDVKAGESDAKAGESAAKAGESDTKKKPESIDDLRKMGYSQEQIDDWLSEGLDPLDEYRNYSPAVSEGDGEGQSENGEENNDAFERGETEPNGDFGFWLKDKHGLTPSELNKLSPEEQKKILDEYAGEKGIETGDNNEGNDTGSGEGSAEDKSGEQNENRENKEETNNEEASNGEKSLAFVSLCTEEEAKLAAHDIAEAMFAERVAHSKNPFKRIIMGNMMKEGVLAHYRKKALEAIVAYNAGENDGNTKYDNHTISQYWSKTGGIERFTKAYMEQVMPAIHQRAGESMQGYTTRTDENGEIYVVTKSRNEAGEIVETRVDADKNPGAKAAIDIRKAIEAYAGGTSDLASLKEQVRRIQQGEGMSDEKLDLSVDNLVELAEAAKQRAEHAGGILNVMDGFSYINGEAMRSVRSESHKTKIERASEWVSEHTMGLVSPEVVGGAASLMMFFADKGARTAARAVAPGIGGALIAGAAAGIRERGRVSGDIQTSSREAAMGKDVSGPEGRAGKYDRQVAETLYNMQSAEALTKGLNSAIESGDTDAMQKALANIEALVNISDSQKVDLIRYSSGENVEDERMNMDIARAKAEVALKKAGVDLNNSEVYRDAINGVRKEISRDMSEKDKARSSLKTKRMLAQGAKTAAVSIAVGTAAREISAYFNPNQVGVLDHVFNKENNYDATNTPLASFLGLKEPDTTIPGQVFTSEVLKYDDQQLTKSQLDALGKAGYRIDSHDVITSSTTTSQVDMGSFAKAHGINPIERNWLSNGTEASDANELRAYYDSSHGWFTGMRGEGFGGGVTRDFQEDIANGRVHAFLSLTRGTQSTPIELSQRIFTAADGTQQIEFFSENADIQKILDAKQGLIEIASESGRVSESGLPIYDIWASWPGEDVSGTITDTVENKVKTTLYDVYETVTERGPDTVVEGAKRLIGGIGIFPFTSRKALHRAKPLPISRPGNPPTPPTPPAPNPEPEPTPTPQPEPEPTPTPQPEPEPEPTPPNPNNIGEQLDDNEVPDVPGWDEEYQFRAHRQNGMEENAENSGNDPEKEAREAEIRSLRERIASSRQRENDNSDDEGVVASERSYRQTLLARLRELTNGQDSQPEGTVENSENDPEKAAREAEINSLRERIASSRQRENDNSNDEGVVASERSYRQTLLARLRELTNGQEGQPEEETVEDAQREAEIRSLRERIASSRQRENSNSNDEGVVASERSYRQTLLARLRELTNGQEGEAEENEGAQPASETGFRPDGGGEWTEANLKEIPNDDAFIISMLSNTSTGQQILAARNSNRIGFNRAMNLIKRRIDRINRSSLTPAQKVAAFNGGSIDGLNRQAREDIASLRADGILSESNS